MVLYNVGQADKQAFMKSGDLSKNAFRNIGYGDA